MFFAATPAAADTELEFEAEAMLRIALSEKIEEVAGEVFWGKSDITELTGDEYQFALQELLRRLAAEAEAEEDEDSEEGTEQPQCPEGSQSAPAGGEC